MNLAALALVRLEAHLQDAVAQRVAVDVLNGQQRLVVDGHGHESESLALVGLRVANHFNRQHRSKGPKQLPQHILLRLRGQIVHEQAPAAGPSAIRGRRRQHGVGNQVPGQGREPTYLEEKGAER